MARGRPPKPIELHRLDGTYRADRHARPPLYVPAARPEPTVAEIFTSGVAYDLQCDDCGQPVTVELLTDHTWRLRHASGREECL